MPNFVKPLHDEIARIARKEATKVQKSLGRVISSLRKENIELRRRLKDLEHQALPVIRKETQSAEKINNLPADEEVGNFRLTPKIIIRMRKKHSLSRQAMAKFLDVNQNSIVNWERGSSTPRAEQKKKLLAFKKMNRREVRKILGLPLRKSSPRTKKAASAKE